MSRTFSRNMNDQHTAVGEYGDVIRQLVSNVDWLMNGGDPTEGVKDRDAEAQPTPVPPVEEAPTEVTYTELAAAISSAGGVTVTAEGVLDDDVLLLVGLNLAISDPSTVPTGWTQIGDTITSGNLTGHSAIALGSVLNAAGSVSYGTSRAALYVWRVEGVSLGSLQNATVDSWLNYASNDNSTQTTSTVTTPISEGQALFIGTLIDGDPAGSPTFAFDDANVDELAPTGLADYGLGGARRAPDGGGDIASQDYTITHNTTFSIAGMSILASPGNQNAGNGNDQDPGGGGGTPGGGSGGGRLMMTFGDGGLGEPPQGPSTTGTEVAQFHNQIAPIDGTLSFGNLGSSPSDTWSRLGSPNEGNENFGVGLADWQRIGISPNTFWYESTLQGHATTPITGYMSGASLQSWATSWLDNYIAGLNWTLARFTDMVVVCRLLHEFNGYWFAWRCGNLTSPTTVDLAHAATYVTVWRAIHDYIRAGCSDNARLKFSWSPNAWGIASTNGSTVEPHTCYPGTAYVDFFAPSIYYANQAGNIPIRGSGLTMETLFREFEFNIDFTGFAAGDVRIALGEWAFAVQESDVSDEFQQLFELLIEKNAAYVNYFYFFHKGGFEPDFTMRNATALERQAFLDGLAAWRLATAQQAA